MTGQKFVWDLRNFILCRKSCTSHATSVFMQSLADVSTGKGHQGTELVARKSRMEGHITQDTEYTKSQDCAKQSTGRQLPHSRCAAAGRAQPWWGGVTRTSQGSSQGDSSSSQGDSASKLAQRPRGFHLSCHTTSCTSPWQTGPDTDLHVHHHRFASQPL